MTDNTLASFDATLLRPAKPGDDSGWAFVVLPKAVSDTLPRRGRTTVAGRLNGRAFTLTLEPDGQLSHWLKLSHELQAAAGVSFGDPVRIELAPIDEPEPTLPADFSVALEANTAALATWQVTTTLARVDWIHWIESAKQAKTRASRIASACDQLAKGKKRVCCFDNSGFYDKSQKAPDVMQ
jgi:hypothetical protein